LVLSDSESLDRANSLARHTFPFDPTKGPGYVWHCHILDHEDNDMMRPMAIVNDDRPSLNSCNACLPGSASVASRFSTPAVTKPAGHDHHKATKRSTPVAGRVTPVADVTD
jgi:hypothetical protein